MSSFDLRVTPEPSAEDEQAIAGAVREILRREEALARPPQWRAASWTSRRAGVSDLAMTLAPGRAWVLSARMPWGGREFPGLHGRGDAK